MDMNKPQNLYRLYSLVDEHPEVGRACLEWVYHLRDEPVLSYDRLIKGYDKLAITQKQQAEERVNQMFTEQEVDVLSTYLDQAHGIESFLEEKAIPINLQYLLSEATPETGAGKWGSLYMFSREDDYNLPFEVWAWVHPRSEHIDLESLITKGYATISWLAREIFRTFPKMVNGIQFYILDCGCIYYQRRFMDGTLAANINTYRAEEDGPCSKCMPSDNDWKTRVVDEKVIYNLKVEIREDRIA